MTKSDRDRWGNPNIRIEEILPAEMIWVTQAPAHGQGFIVKPQKGDEKHKEKLEDFVIVNESNLLHAHQLELMSNIILDSTSYWLGIPIFKRFPPKPSFVVRLYRENQYLDVMMDVSNSGWDFYHSSVGNRRQLFNWVGAETRKLYHQLFPISSRISSLTMWKNEHENY